VLRSVHLGTGESNHTVLSPRLAPGAELCKCPRANLLIVDTLGQFAGWVADSEMIAEQTSMALADSRLSDSNSAP